MLCKINEQMTTLEQEAHRKQMLVDNMAHELRTPLTSIHGYAEYLEKGNVTEERKVIAAKYCRENNLTTLGIGLGMQVMAIEVARNSRHWTKCVSGTRRV